jgi:hypothetical protein
VELHSRLYYKHLDDQVMKQLEALFTTHHGDEEKFIQSSLVINPEAGDTTQELLDQIDSVEYDLAPESLVYVAGFAVLDFTHGSNGDENIENILLFLKELLPDIHVQARGQGDDDPWEFWFKFDGDEMVREDDEPFNDPEDDEEIKASIYQWWHEGMPEQIKEGFLNED